MIGYQALYDKLSQALAPDLDLSLDDWSDKFMIIPKSTGSNEYGPYRTSRTPHARKIMQCLSDDHPCKRVVAKVASQMFKTQICLNWFASTVHQSPSNFLWLMPTGRLQKRIAARIDKTIAAVPVLTERVAKPRSRDALNNQDSKEYIGGTLFIATAGSAANLSEVPARRVAIDEVDRGEDDVQGEGDPVKLAEARQTTFEYNRKSYYYSSPTIDGESRIDDLFMQGTQREALYECIHCHTPQPLAFENLIVDGKWGVLYPCKECGGVHFEKDKNKMFAEGIWSDPVMASDTESFTANAMFLPYGWLSWEGLYKQHADAKELLDKGDDSEMVVFWNTRLARTWKRSVQVVSYQSLLDRAEHYQLRLAPRNVLMVTAAVDTQDNRLEVQIVGWGRNMAATILDYVVLNGDPANDEVWDNLTELINSGIEHETGRVLPIIATAIDTGGHRSEAVKHYVRSARIRTPIAVKGASTRDAPAINKGSMQDITWKGTSAKKGVKLYSVGTIAIKNKIFSFLKNDSEKDPDKRMIRFSNSLTPEYFGGLVSEYFDERTKKYEKKHQGIRNEPLDTLTYCYATLYHESIRAHLYSQKKWDSLEASFDNPIKKIEVKQEDPPIPAKVVSNVPPPALRGRGKSMMGALRGRLGR